MDDTFTYEYIPHRGLTKETLKFYGILTKVDKEGKPISDGFPYPNGIFKVRGFDRKDILYWHDPQGKVSEAGLFGMDKFSSGSHQSVTITEGEYDAPSLYQVLGSAVVSVQSAATAKRDCVRCHEWLSGFERIYLAFDNDDAGRRASREVAKLFDHARVFHVKFTKHKDANDYLKAGETEELRKIWSNSKTYLPDNVKSSLAEFKEALKSRPVQGVPAYPSSTLNDMTYGIRTSETVLITAPEKIGKTEFMRAIEYNLLKGTDSNVGSIFIEETEPRHLQGLAGLELGVPAHLPDCPSTEDEVALALERVVRHDGRLHVYTHYGSSDPDVLCDTIRFLVSACGCRYILLDHISMVVSGLQNDGDERRILDYLSTKLEMMVKELDFALILVSHVNDEGQTRGSRYISKVTDIRIDITRNPIHPDEIERNTLYITLVNNRPCAKTGPAGSLFFDQSTFTFRENAA